MDNAWKPELYYTLVEFFKQKGSYLFFFSPFYSYSIFYDIREIGSMKNSTIYGDYDVKIMNNLILNHHIETIYIRITLVIMNLKFQMIVYRIAEFAFLIVVKSNWKTNFQLFISIIVNISVNRGQIIDHHIYCIF